MKRYDINGVKVSAELYNMLEGENIEFILHSKFTSAAINNIPFLVLGGAWTFYGLFFFLSFYYQSFKGWIPDPAKLTHAPENIIIIVTLGALVIFVLTGVFIILASIRHIAKSGCWYIGTDRKLIVATRRRVHFYDWDQFTPDIELIGNDKKGSLILNMKTGKTIIKKSGKRVIVPEKIEMSGIRKMLTVEAVIRKHLKNRI